MKLNKKVLASVIAAGILTTGTALANPFDDVPKGHWAYDAVQSLADQGVVEGFGEGTYRGDKLMTRYEMAQIVARAMSVTKGETNAAIDKLAAEFNEELDALGVKVNKLEKSTAGVKDLKISHWFQTENTYGKSFDNTTSHEYEMEYRLSAEKQISDKLGVLMQMETKTFWDQPAYGSVDNGANYGSRDGVYTRLAYLTYKPDQKTTIVAGKNAYWWAGGLLGDDYVEGVDITTQLGKNTTLELAHGRYWADREKYKDNKGSYVNDQITYAGLNTKFGEKVDFGVHYLTGQNGIVWGGDTKIWGVTAGFDLGAGVNLSLGYAKDTGKMSKALNDVSGGSSLTKVQLYKKLGKVDTFLQYWKQDSNYNAPLENGNHLAWWGDQYGREGVKGYRLILGYPVSANCYAEAWYGQYKKVENWKGGTDDSAKKFGWALTFSY